MADSFIDGCYDPKKPSPDQLYPLLYKTSAAAEIVLCQLHFHGTKEAFVSERKLLDNGVDAICLETMDGQRKWIDKDLAEAFAFKRKYLFVDPSAVDADGMSADEIQNMVFIEEQGQIAGIVMILRI